ncbi:MAG: aspartate--tRNA ligase [Armatimonadetes bacterium]|nr:aspartate--tRNA ligase [Armatimonadota bacterium]
MEMPVRFMKRTLYCGDVREDHIGQQVVLNGWVHRRRDHGGVIFLDLRDRAGLVQVVFDPSEAAEAHALAEHVRSEYVLAVKGEVARRPEGTENPHLATGAVEVRARELEILNVAQPPPFALDEPELETDELIRMKYRYLDLRTERMQRNLYLRHRTIQAVRNFMTAEGFWEVHTPLLFRPTPEGARDYLVPSRVNPGCFYALPQSPQLLKQILMVAGVDRYFQIAPCLRDEDLRADRQPEHHQIDIEMSFVERDDILDLTERLFAHLFGEVIGYELQLPLPRMSYAEALERFGTDKPDLRYGMELRDISDLAAKCGFEVFRRAVEAGGQVKGLAAPGCADYSRKQIDELTKFAKAHKAGGLVTVALLPDGSFKSPSAKYFSEEEFRAMAERLGAGPGDLMLFVADQPAIVAEALDWLRREMAARLGLVREGTFEALWVLDFPLLAWNEDEQRWEAEHHPFCMPHPEDVDFLDTDPGRVRALAYDLVINGWEIGSGSVRIHRRDIQEKVFSLLGIDHEEAEKRFGFLLKAFEYGAPPHGGIAPGLDRTVALLAGEDNIRQVIAFPKTQSAQCLMSGAPVPVDEAQLREVHIRLDLPPEAQP